MLEMRKSDFIDLLKDCDLLIFPKKKEEEKKDGKNAQGGEGEKQAAAVKFEESDV